MNVFMTCKKEIRLRTEIFKYLVLPILWTHCTSGLSNLIVSLSQGIRLASPKLDVEVVCDMFDLEKNV